jgi:hypothetical protein
MADGPLLETGGEGGPGGGRYPEGGLGGLGVADVDGVVAGGDVDALAALAAAVGRLEPVNYSALERRACTTGITGGDGPFASSPAPECPGRGRGR